MTSNFTKKFLCNRTLRVYYHMIACDKGLSVFTNPQRKSVTRAQAERSLRSMMSFILTVALTSFLIGIAPKNHPALRKKGTQGSHHKPYMILFSTVMVVGIYTQFFHQC